MQKKYANKINKGQGLSNTIRTKANSIESKEKASQLPKSKYYRESLEPFHNSVILLQCHEFEYEKFVVDNVVKCVKVLLKNPEIIKVSASLRDVPLPIIDHLWAICNIRWLEYIQNNYKEGDYLKIKAFVNEYKINGHRNIGIQPISCKTIKKK